MESKKKKWINSEWGVTIGGVLIGFMLTVIYDLAKSLPILSTTGLLIRRFFAFIIKLFNFELKIWWLLCVYIIYRIIKAIISSRRKPMPHSYDFRPYRSDKINGWKWSWSWRFSSHQKAWVIDNLQPHCPRCDTTMAIVYSGFYGVADKIRCPRCTFEVDQDQKNHHKIIESIILDNIRREEEKFKKEKQSPT